MAAKGLDTETNVDVSGGGATAKAVPLILIKAYYFSSFCWFATFFRYLTLYFEHDGLTAAQIGMLWGVFRILQTIITPFVSAFADKTKQSRRMLMWSHAICSLPFLALAIPLPEDFEKMVPRAAAFWLFALSSSPAFGLRDAMAIAACGGDSDLWGKSRVYGAVGWGMMHLVLGPIMDSVGFSVLFVSFFVLDFIQIVIIRSSLPESCGDVKKEVTASAVLEIFSNNWLFFVNMTFIGAGFSMVEGMLFLLLQEMEASNLLCGLAVVVTVIFELPIFHYAKYVLEKLGTRNMILLGQIAWVVRAFFYANMTEAWTVLLIEPLHGVTFALVWTAATQHVADPAVSGQGLEASAQGLLQATFMGVGPVLGLSIGGWLFDNLGSHAVYGVFAVVVLAVGVAYSLWGGNESSSYGMTGTQEDTKSSAIGKGADSRVLDDELPHLIKNVDYGKDRFEDGDEDIDEHTLNKDADIVDVDIS